MSTAQILLILNLLFPSKPEYVHPCERDRDILSLETKIEMSIGCSYIGTRTAYSSAKLEYVYEKDKLQSRR